MLGNLMTDGPGWGDEPDGPDSADDRYGLEPGRWTLAQTRFTPDEEAWLETAVPEWFESCSAEERAAWEKAEADSPGLGGVVLRRGLVLARREARGEPIVRDDEVLS